MSATARAGSGAASRTSAGAKIHAAIQLETIHVKIDLDGLNPIQERLVHHVLETVHIKLPILIIGLIQSHGQARAASPAFIQKDADGFDLFTVKIGRDLFRGRRCYFEHDCLLQ